MSLAERRGLRLFTLSVLFFAQGIPWGFMAITLPAYLAQRGLGEAALGSLAAMTTLPYAFKWVWGPVMDAFTIPRLGRRRPWIVLAQVMMSLTVAALLAFPDLLASFDLVLVVILVHTVFNAMQNVAVDALAIDLLEASERGRANGIMYGSKYAGGIVGGAGMATMIGHYGLRSAIVTQVIVLFAITLVPLLVRERPGPAPPRPAVGVVVRAIGRAFRARSTVLAALVMLAQNLAGGMLFVVALVLFTQHLHWDQAEYSQIAGGPGLLVGFGGSVLAGFLADKVGHRRLAAIACATMACGWLAFALGESWWTNRTFVYGLFVVEPLAQSVMTVSLWAMCMATSSPPIAATQFAIYTSLMNLSTTLGSKVFAGYASAWWDFRTIYIVAAGIQLAVIAILPFIDPNEARLKRGGR